MTVMRKKAFLSYLICSPLIYPIAKRLSSGSLLRILAYHKVMDINEAIYPFDEEVISASKMAFDKQMTFVSRNYNVITFRDMDASLKKRQSLPERPLIITFDDGYADNYYNAFPVLKRYGLRAVFFISTDYMGGNKPFWFETIIYVGKKGLLEVQKLGLDLASHSDDGPSGGAKAFRKYLMKIPNSERLRLLKMVEEKTQLQIPRHDLEWVRPLTWTQVREMADAGMEIGSHTKSHLILGNAFKDELRDELKESKRIIEKEAGQRVRSISYPMGSKNFAVTSSVIEEVRAAGYRWGMSNVSGFEKVPFENALFLKRLKVERYVNFDWFRSQLLFPEIFS